MKKLATLTAISLLILASAALAQTGTVVGTVLTPTGEAAVGARVSLHSDAACVAYVLTDDSGAFVLTDVEPGVYSLKVGLQRVGQATVAGIEVIDGQTTEVPTITLAGNGPHGPNGPKGPRPARI